MSKNKIYYHFFFIIFYTPFSYSMEHILTFVPTDIWTHILKDGLFCCTTLQEAQECKNRYAHVNKQWYTIATHLHTTFTIQQATCFIDKLYYQTDDISKKEIAHTFGLDQYIDINTQLVSALEQKNVSQEDKLNTIKFLIDIKHADINYSWWQDKWKNNDIRGVKSNQKTKSVPIKEKKRIMGEYTPLYISHKQYLLFSYLLCKGAHLHQSHMYNGHTVFDTLIEYLNKGHYFENNKYFSIGNLTLELINKSAILTTLLKQKKLTVKKDHICIPQSIMSAIKDVLAQDTTVLSGCHTHYSACRCIEKLVKKYAIDHSTFSLSTNHSIKRFNRKNNSFSSSMQCIWQKIDPFVLMPATYKNYERNTFIHTLIDTYQSNIITYSYTVLLNNINCLLQKGIDVNAQEGKEGNTALHKVFNIDANACFSIKSSSTGIQKDKTKKFLFVHLIDLLIKYNANPSIRNYAGENIYDKINDFACKNYILSRIRKNKEEHDEYYFLYKKGYMSDEYILDKEKNTTHKLLYL